METVGIWKVADLFAITVRLNKNSRKELNFKFSSFLLFYIHSCMPFLFSSGNV